ncbi:protoporphyrinogen oxidase [Salmonella enterica subsp. enterica serovar Typhimurium]|nr:protoporphyrinogen oxidase [Salmonella enterica subsp. enterica serovar Typhimurium]
MKTLILFSTRDGQTREIASYLASELKDMGSGPMSLICIAQKSLTGIAMIA